MPPTSPDEQGSIRDPHPLCARLIARFRGTGAAVLEVGTGSGRNARAITAAGIALTGLADARIHDELSAAPRSHFGAALSTHALLHGTPVHISAMMACIARALRRSGLLYATFGSTNDARFGQGQRLGDVTFAPTTGDEAGVAHTYFTRARLEALLAPCFDIEHIEEVAVDDIAGRWAHPSSPLHGSRHWFVEGHKRT